MESLRFGRRRTYATIHRTAGTALPQMMTPFKPSSAKQPTADTRARTESPKTDDLLERVFALYKAHTAPLLRLAAIPATLYLFGSILRRLLAHREISYTKSASANAVAVALLLTPAVLLLTGYALTQAATAIYVDSTDNAWKALRQAWPHTFRCLGIALWQIGSMVWLPTACGIAAASAFHFGRRTMGEALLFAVAAACVYGVIAWLRNSLALPAAGIESLQVRAAMRRSKALVNGRTWHFLKALISLVLLGFVGYFVQDFCRLFLAQAKAPVQQAVGLALGFAVQFVLALLLAPVVNLTFSLLYFEERAQSERPSR